MRIQKNIFIKTFFSYLVDCKVVFLTKLLNLSSIIVFSVFCYSPLLADTSPDSITLTGTIRDFSDTHPDMEIDAYNTNKLDAPNVYSVTEMIESTIGVDRKPVYKTNFGTLKGNGPKNGDLYQSFTSAASFAQWFNDVPGVNQSMEYNLTLQKIGNVYTYDSDNDPKGHNTEPLGFFPIDAQLLGDQGNIHNYHFSFEIHSRFTYQGGETFSFKGDDDVWVFVNDQLVVDIGGIHRAVEESVDLDTLGLTLGETYDFDFFFVERKKSHSNLKVVTNIELEGIPVCTAFTGEVSEVSLPLESQLKTTDKLFVPSRDISTSTGHLRSYNIDNNGVPATSAGWDAATLMNATNRANGLYSTDDSGTLAKFNGLTEVSSDIKTHIINAPLGSVSRGNDLELITKKVNISPYLASTSYRDYYSDNASTRDQLVLMSSDDGFLYAFDYITGLLKWAWMPRSLLSDITASDSYHAKHLMAGSVEVLDLPGNTGDYATYVVGSYKNGLGHYVLKLDNDGNLAELVWDDDQSAKYTESPNDGEMEFFRDSSGDVYAAYVLANTSTENTSQLKIRGLATDSVDMSVDLNYQATSTPFVMPDFDKRNAPAKHTLYLGSLTGKIHTAVVLGASGALKSETDIQSELQAASVATMAEAPSDAVIYIDASGSLKDGQYYLSVQSATRLSVLNYQSSDNSWKNAWTSYSSGAGSWDNTDVYTEDNSGVPTVKSGFQVVPPSKGIQSMPVDAIISGKATIVADNIVVPLTVLDKSSAVCYGKAYFYMYKLTDGNFPQQSFSKLDGTEIAENIALGYGEAAQLSLSDLSGTDQLLGYGVADKDVSLESGIATSFYIKDPITSGLRGWKEIIH